MTALPDLVRRISSKIDRERAMQLSADDLALFGSTRAYAMLCEEAAQAQRDQCLQRSARSRSTKGENSSSSPGSPEPEQPEAKPSRSFGTIANDDANEALARAQAIAGKPS